MQKMEVTGAYVEIMTGKVKLTDEQAKVRMYGLEKTSSKGVYQVLRRVGFKRGEVFGYDGPDMGRGFMENINGGSHAHEPEPETEETGSTEGNAAKPGEIEITVKQLAEMLDFTIGDTITLLKDYGVDASKGADVVATAVADEILNDNKVSDDSEESDESGQ